jgi:hypothetical protein
MDAITGVMATIDAMKDAAMGNKPWRDGALREEFDGVIIDTTLTVFDTGKAETGISTDSGGSWTIVEQYEDVGAAKSGHEKWVKLMKENPKRELKDLNLWELEA